VSGPVLLCFDGSEGATRAIRTAAQILSGREALVLSVAVLAQDEFPHNPMGEIVGKLSRLYRQWDEYAAEVAASHAARGAEIATEKGLTARALTATGKPAATILRVASEHRAEVIVLGAQRRGWLSGALGSVSERVAREAGRPVLVIPTK
jgi:nucleotide-binding universal stress UspA family protein